MLTKRAAVCYALAVFALPLVGRADEPPIRAADIPREFQGKYEWRDGNGSYTSTLKIDKIEAKDGLLRFTGSHAYTPGDLKTKVEGTIDPRSRRLIFRESEPSEAADTDGMFEGTIAQDLRAIRAVWTNQTTGAKGDLELQAKK
jgi:hypothetical protein